MHKRKTFCWNTLGCIMQADTKTAWKKNFDTECVSVLHQSAAGMSFWDSKGEKKKKVIIFLCFYCENVKNILTYWEYRTPVWGASTLGQLWGSASRSQNRQWRGCWGNGRQIQKKNKARTGQSIFKLVMLVTASHDMTWFPFCCFLFFVFCKNSHTL